MKPNILIAGASSGMAIATAQALKASGYGVIGLSRNADLSGYDELQIIENYLQLPPAPESLAGLVFFPGNIRLTPFHRIKPEEFLQDYELNVLNAIRCLQHYYPALKKHGKASVVLMSSVAAGTGMSFHSSTGSVKAAVEGLTRALAAEWAPSIRVNAVAPSLTDTPMAGKLMESEEKRSASAQRHPLKRTGTAEDIAASITFLLSDASGWMSGQILHTDGGMSSIRNL
jgi:3-oxoacyl-[acyl-carrier protein] reductase